MKGNDKMETIYRASDGTIFEDKDECKEYERKEALLMLDCDMERTNNPYEAHYVMLRSMKNLQKADLIWLCETDIGYTNFYDFGCYCLTNDDENALVSIDTEIYNLHQRIKKLEEVRFKMYTMDREEREAHAQ